MRLLVMERRDGSEQFLRLSEDDFFCVPNAEFIDFRPATIHELQVDAVMHPEFYERA